MIAQTFKYTLQNKTIENKTYTLTTSDGNKYKISQYQTYGEVLTATTTDGRQIKVSGKSGWYILEDTKTIKVEKE